MLQTDHKKWAACNETVEIYLRAEKRTDRSANVDLNVETFNFFFGWRSLKIALQIIGQPDQLIIA